MAGKTVQTENAVIYNDVLQKTVYVSPSIGKGTYLIGIVINDSYTRQN
jgi:hypothetical protein